MKTNKIVLAASTGFIGNPTTGKLAQVDAEYKRIVAALLLESTKKSAETKVARADRERSIKTVA